MNDDPSGCRDASRRAMGLRKEGKLAAARADLVACSNFSCPSDARSDCTRRLKEVDAATPTVVFGFKDAGGTNLSAVKISADGRTIVDRADGTPVAVDPGDHLFAFEAEGRTRVEKHFALRDGEKGRKETIVFAASTAAPSQPGAPAFGADADDTPPSVNVNQPAPEVPSRGDDPTKGAIGFIVGAVGGGAGILAIYEEVVAQGRNSDANKAAASPSADVRATADTIHDQGVEAQTYALISSGVAVAGLGVGLYLVLTSLDRTPAPNASSWQVSPVISPRVGGVRLERSF